MAKDSQVVIGEDAEAREIKLRVDVQRKVHSLGFANKATEALAQFASHMLVNSEDEKLKLQWWDRVFRASQTGVAANTSRRKQLQEDLGWQPGQS